MIQPSRWTDLDEIWHERYVIEAHPKIVLFSFVQ
jgi:hypothetical protein